jgi:hypothetical protein
MSEEVDDGERSSLGHLIGTGIALGFVHVLTGELQILSRFIEIMGECISSVYLTTCISSLPSFGLTVDIRTQRCGSYVRISNIILWKQL